MKKGFTLIEVLIVLSIVTTLFGMSIIGLNSFQQNTYQNTSEDVFLSDLKLQQLKSMSGDNFSTSTVEPFGIYFSPTSYTLFRGNTYSSSDPENFTVELNPNLTFSSVAFANSQIIFEKNSGDIVGFVPGNNTITITNSITGIDSVITLNKHGAITNIQ